MTFCLFTCISMGRHLKMYSEIHLKRTHRDHENLFLITEVPYKRIVNELLGKACEIKISSLLPEIPINRVPLKTFRYVHVHTVCRMVRYHLRWVISTKCINVTNHDRSIWGCVWDEVGTVLAVKQTVLGNPLEIIGVKVVWSPLRHNVTDDVNRGKVDLKY